MKRHFSKETPALFIYVLSGTGGLAGFLGWTAWNSASVWMTIACWTAAVILGWIALGLLRKALAWKGVMIDGAKLVIIRRFARDCVFSLPKDLSSVTGRAKTHQLVIGLNNGTQRWRLVLAGIEDPGALLEALDNLIPVMRQQRDGSRVASKFSEIDTRAEDRFIIGLSENPKTQ